MASLKRIPRSPFWIACFRKADGTATSRSTKVEGYERDRKKALKIAEAFERAYREVRTVRHAAKVLDEIAQEVGGERLQLGIARHSNQWFENIQRTRTPGTIKVYEVSIRRWLRWLEDRGLTEEPVSRLERQDIVNFRDRMEDQHGAKAANRCLAVVNQILDVAKADGLAETNPAARVGKASEDEPFQRDPFTREDLAKLWEAASDSLEWRNLLMLGLFTGQRLGDLRKLKWSHIDLEKREIRITTQKTKRNQVCLIPPPLANWLTNIRPASGDPHELICPRFGTIDRNRPTKLFGELIDRSGLPFEHIEVSGRRFRSKSFHSLRHTLPSMLLELGTSPKIIQEILGHDDAQSTARYTHAERSQVAEALGRLTNPFG